MTKEKIISHLKKHRVIYLLSCWYIIFLIFHLIYNSNMVSDDCIHYQFFPDEFDSLSEFLIVRYNNWTSRLSVETVMFLFINNRVAFAIIDSAVYVLVVYFVYILFEKKSIVLSLIGVAIIPFYLYTFCGLYAFSVNYTWPVACLLYILFLTKKNLKNEKIRAWEYFLGIISALFVAFVEYGTVILLVISLVTFVKNCVKNKKFSVFLALMIVIGLAGIIIMFLSPGNALRRQHDAAYFPEYSGFNIFEKFEYGLIFVATATSLRFIPIYLAFYASLIFLSFYKRKNKFTKLCAMIPVISLMLFYIIYLSRGFVNGSMDFVYLNNCAYLETDLFLKYMIVIVGIINIIFPFISILLLTSGEKRIFLSILFILQIGIIGSYIFVGGSIAYYANFRPVIFSSMFVLIIILELIFSEFDYKFKIKINDKSDTPTEVVIHEK